MSYLPTNQTDTTNPSRKVNLTLPKFEKSKQGGQRLQPSAGDRHGVEDGPNYSLELQVRVATPFIWMLKL